MQPTVVGIVGEVRALLDRGEEGRGQALALLHRHLERAPERTGLRLLAGAIGRGTRDSSALFRHSVEADAGEILGFLDIPYHPEAGLEAIAFTEIAIPDAIVRAAPPSTARCVIPTEATAGFGSETFVGLFPEHFVGHVPQAEEPAFYFMDKFVDRVQRVTLPLIRTMWRREDFAALLAAPVAEIRTACAIWTWLHEGFHKTGPLPLPEYLGDKSSLTAAAFEETRVDLLALELLRGLAGELPVAGLTFDLILAERLIRYAALYDPASSFDARGSVAMFAGLCRAGAVMPCGEGRRHRLDRARLDAWIAGTGRRMRTAETTAKAQPAGRRKKTLERAFAEIAGQAPGPWVRTGFHRRASAVLPEGQAPA
jgi:hypothetical protein